MHYENEADTYDKNAKSQRCALSPDLFIISVYQLRYSYFPLKTPTRSRCSGGFGLDF